MLPTTDAVDAGCGLPKVPLHSVIEKVSARIRVYTKLACVRIVSGGDCGRPSVVIQIVEDHLTASSSPRELRCPDFDSREVAACTTDSSLLSYLIVRESLKWLHEHIEKLIMLNKQRR